MTVGYASWRCFYIFTLINLTLTCWISVWFAFIANIVSPLGCVRLHVYLSGAVLVWVCVLLLVVHGTFMSAQLFSFLVNPKMCVCVCVRRGVLQGQNELMLNIPYWFYCNSFLILSLFNFISLRLVGMEMRSVLFSCLFFACVNCSYHLKPFEQDYPDGLAWCAWSFIFLLCLLFLLGCRGKERELGSLLKALGKARRQQLWQREIWGKKKKSELGRDCWGVHETGVGGVAVCMCVCAWREGALKSKAENTSRYEHDPLPGLAVKGTGITLGVLKEGAGGVGMLWMGTGRTWAVHMWTYVWSKVLFADAEKCVPL